MADESGRLKALLIGFLVFGLFGFLILTSVADISRSYPEADTTDVLNGSLNVENYRDYLEEAETQVGERSEQFEKQTPFSALVEVVSSGIWFVSFGFIAVILTPATLVYGLIYLIVGDTVLAGLITGTLSSILLISIIYGVWRVLKAGD